MITILICVQHGPPQGNDPSRRKLPNQRASQPRGFVSVRAEAAHVLGIRGLRRHAGTRCEDHG